MSKHEAWRIQRGWEKLTETITFEANTANPLKYLRAPNSIRSSVWMDFFSFQCSALHSLHFSVSAPISSFAPFWLVSVRACTCVWNRLFFFHLFSFGCLQFRSYGSHAPTHENDYYTHSEHYMYSIGCWYTLCSNWHWSQLECIVNEYQ